MRFSIGLVKLAMDRMQTHMSKINIFLLLYIAFKQGLSPYWLLLGVFVIPVLIIDFKYIYPSEHNERYTRIPFFQEMRKDINNLKNERNV